MSELFDEKWKQDLEKKYSTASKYSKPFIATLVLDRDFEKEKGRIERWFQTLPDKAKRDFTSRLRSTDNCEHFGAYSELLLSEIIKHVGYSVDFHPDLKGQTPDLRISGPSISQVLIVEIATVFNDTEQQKKERKFHTILACLDKIRHHYNVLVFLHSDIIPVQVNYKQLARFVKNRLDEFYTEDKTIKREFEYKEEGLVLSFSALPLEQETSIVAGNSDGVRFIGTAQIKNALIGKINRYKSVKENDIPFIVALNLSHSVLDDTSLIRALFGNPSITIYSDKEGNVVNEKEGLDATGILTPKRGLAGRSENTRLSAVLLFGYKWKEHNNDEGADRLFFLSVVHNPWAGTPISAKLFQGYPQFVKIAEDSKGISLGWVNKENNALFDLA